VPAVGGEPEPFADLADYADLDYPDVLPGGEWVLFTASGGGDWSDAEILAQNVATGERKTLVEGGHFARYVPSGHLVFARGGTLFAIVFDSERLETVGSPVPLVVGVVTQEQGGDARFAVGLNGTLVYVGGDSAEAVARTLVWVDREGREESIAAPPRAYNNGRISPDGATVALDVRDQDFDIWTWSFTRETLTRLTFDPAQDEFPVWSPDGRQIAFSSTARDGAESNGTLFWRAADGTGSAEYLAGSDGQIFPTSFLPDSTGVLVFGGGLAGGVGDDIGIFRMDGEDRATPLLDTMFEESYPAVSPDGRWLAYVSDESGSEEVYVRPFPDIDTGGRWQVSTSGGTQPLWARDGQELFYRSGGAVIAVPVQTDPNFTVGNPQVLFEGDYHLAPGGPNYDVSPDGERFLMIRGVEGTSQLTVVLNWFSELERLAPVAE